MSVWADGEPCDVWERTTPKARKQHQGALGRGLPDGRYSFVRSLEEEIQEYLAAVAEETAEETTDEWDEITATETPMALNCLAYPRKRSGVYARSHAESKALDVIHAKRKCSGEDG
jgi:hypothetical protein